MTHVFIDGACKGNEQLDDAKRRAGYGVYWEGNEAAAISAALPPAAGVKLSNNRAETMAAVHVLETLASNTALHKVVIHTDSNLLLQTVTVWLPNSWRANEYRKANGEPVANMDLIRRLDALLLCVGDRVEWRKVKAHTAEPRDVPRTDRRWLNWYGNAEADRLANVACGATQEQPASNKRRCPRATKAGGAKRAKHHS